MMMTRSQTASTSERMCVESRTVCPTGQLANRVERLADLQRVEAGGRSAEDQDGRGR